MKKANILNPKLFFAQHALSNDELGSKTFEESIESFSTDKQAGDLYCCIKPILKFGRIIGIIPINGLWKRSGILKYKWNNLAAITSILVTVALSINVVFSFLSFFRRFAGTGGGNAVDFALSAKGPIFYLTVVLIYVFFQYEVRKLIALCATWRKVSSDLKIKRCDEKLSHDINILAFLIYSSAFIETVLAHLTHFPIIEHTSHNTSNASKDHSNAKNESQEDHPLEIYYLRSHPFWALYIPYHSSLAILLLICNLVSVHAWNYADIIIIAFSRALYFKFKSLVEVTEECLVSAIDNRSIYKLNGISWAEVRRDHLILCKLLDEFEAFLSPLIFLSYSVNIFFICLQLHQGLTSGSDRTFLDSISSTWSFFHLIFRIMTMSITASKINEYAHQISGPIQKCCSTEYCKELERLERMLGNGSLGLSGLGCFVLTRAFILMVLSVIFTMEIVLLQTSATTSAAKI